MTTRNVLVTTPFLFQRRGEWNEGYSLIGPAAIAAGLPAEVAKTVEVIVTDGDALDPTLVDTLPNLKLVACFSTGYAGIDVAQLRNRNITLTTAAGINAHDVADHAMALMLAWWHAIPRADENVRKGLWRANLPPRPSLRGKRVGIAGLGRIGLQIAHRAHSHGLVVSWWGPHEKPYVGFERAPDLLSLARHSDILVLSLRATPAVTGIVDAAILEALGPTGLLVNVSRGFLVDERALLTALQNRTIAGAALDVFATEPADGEKWRQLDNVILSPHIAGYTREAGVALFDRLRENLRRHFAGQPPLRGAY